MKTIADSPKMWDVKYFSGSTTFNDVAVGMTEDDVIRHYKKYHPTRSILSITEIKVK